MLKNTYKSYPNEKGYFGQFGGRYVSETLMPLILEVEKEISTYKPYLENYFSLLGNNKTNFFTDISNYISYERGQPTHCFKRESITKDLTFSKQSCNDAFQTLLGNEIKLRSQLQQFYLDDLKHKNIEYVKDQVKMIVSNVIADFINTRSKNIFTEKPKLNFNNILDKYYESNLWEHWRSI